MRIVLLASILCAAACGSGGPPPRDPAPVATLTPSNATVPPAPEVPPPTHSTPAGPGRDLTSSGLNADSPQPLAPSAPAPAAPAAGASPQQGDATVQRDPGAHDQTAAADNTKVNDRDRHGALTPMDQGNSADESKITAAIRRGLMKDKSLSFTAKNVKIITVGTKVTLRGPVNTEQERAAIELRAKQTPGVTDVDDQIEVKK